MCAPTPHPHPTLSIPSTPSPLTPPLTPPLHTSTPSPLHSLTPVPSPLSPPLPGAANNACCSMSLPLRPPCPPLCSSLGSVCVAAVGVPKPCPGSGSATDSSGYPLVECSANGACSRPTTGPVCRTGASCSVACVCTSGYSGNDCSLTDAALASAQGVGAHPANGAVPLPAFLPLPPCPASLPCLPAPACGCMCHMRTVMGKAAARACKVSRSLFTTLILPPHRTHRRRLHTYTCTQHTHTPAPCLAGGSGLRGVPGGDVGPDGA